MTQLIAISLLGAFAAFALQDWRRALPLVFVLGLLQDPFRKLVPGYPAYFVLYALVGFGVVVAAAMLRRNLAPLPTLFMRDRSLRFAWMLYFVVIALQAIHSLLRWGNPLLPTLGLVFYLGPVFGVLLVAGYCRERPALALLRAYVLVGVVAGLTIFVSYFFPGLHQVFDDIGALTGGQIIIYDLGQALLSYSGLMRTGEIAGWHGATAACLLIIFGLMSGSNAKRLLFAFLIVALLGAIVLTGRRKMLMMVAVFVGLYVCVLFFFRGGSKRVAVLGAIGVSAAGFGVFLTETQTTASYYVQRGLSGFDDAGGRVQLALRLFFSAIERSDGIGLGIGVSSLGARYAGGSGALAAAVGGSSEAGLGQIVLELGIVGAAVCAVLVLLTFRRLLRSLSLLRQTSDRWFILVAGLVAIFGSNLVAFIVSSLVYSDPFVLVVLGVLAGITLFACDRVAAQAIGRPIARGMSERERDARRPLQGGATPGQAR